MFRKYSTTDLTYAALLTALAIILSYFPEIPLAFFAPWLKLDFSFTPLLLLGFSIGPGMAIIATVVTNVVHILVGTTGGIGELANIIIGLAFILPPSFMYLKNHTWRGAIVGMLIGIVTMVFAAVLANRFILLPTYFGSGFEQAMGNMGMSVSGYLWGGILPFNLIKGGINCLLVQALYKRLSGFMKKSVSEVAIPNGKQG